MKDRKKSFLLLLEYQDVIEALSNEDAGLLIKAIYKYEATGEVIELPPVVKIAFIPIKNKLDENRDKYEAKCELNRANGNKGGRPKNETEENPKKPNGFSENQTVNLETEENPKKPDNEYDNDLNDLNDFDNDSDNDLKPPISPFEDFSPKIQNKLNEWMQYKKERKEVYKPTGLKSFISQFKNKLAIYAEEDVIELIDECMANNWRGIIWDKLADGKKRVNSGNPFMDMLRGGDTNDKRGNYTDFSIIESGIPDDV